MAGGRPSKYTEEYAVQATKLCELGATDKDLADFFSVSLPTIWRWQSAHPEFCSALKVGKSAADDRVERSLYHKANGYSFKATKIFMPANASAPVYAPYIEHIPPDTTACIFWLKNRRPEQWREKQETEHSGSIGISVTLFRDDQSSVQLAPQGLPTPALEGPKERQETSN